MPSTFPAQGFSLVNVPDEHVTEQQRREIRHLRTQDCFPGLSQQELAEDFVAQRVSLVLCSLDDEIVGCAGTYIREMQLEGDKLLLGGIGGVCTRADMRGRGVATSVCRTALEFLRTAKCDVAFLAATPMAKKVYEKLGFQALAQGYSWENTHGVIKFGDDGMVAPLCSPVMAAKILQGPNRFHVGLGYW